MNDRETQVALRRARRVRRGPVSVACVPDSGSAAPRVAYAVGRRSGGAVQRNRIRRRLRSAMGELAPRLAGRAWLVGAGSDAVALEYPALRSHCDDAVAALIPASSPK